MPASPALKFIARYDRHPRRWHRAGALLERDHQSAATPPSGAL